MRFLFLPIRSLKPSLLHSLSRYSSLASPNPPPMDPTEAALRQTLADKPAAADVQSAAFRSLKAAGAPKPEIAAAIDALKALKLEFESVARELKNAVVGNGETSVNREAFRQAVVNTLERRLFYIPSFKIYRSVAGLYDYGPLGCAVKANVLAFWRQEFYALKHRCSGRHGNSLKCSCLVAVKKEDKNVRRTVLNSVVGTLDLSIKQFLHGETFPGELKKANAVLVSHEAYGAHQYAYVANLCVAKYARRQGIATNMLYLASDMAISTGMKQLFVHVNIDNKPAQELYRKAGFQVVEAAPPSNDQRLLMCIEL